MGVFRHPVILFARDGEGSLTLEALVATGASYTVVPSSVLARLGIVRQFQREFILGDGRRVTLGMGIADIQLLDERMPTPCVFGEEGAEPLLGAVTLEQFGLQVDPLGRRLLRVPGYLV